MKTYDFFRKTLQKHKIVSLSLELRRLMIILTVTTVISPLIACKDSQTSSNDSVIVLQKDMNLYGRSEPKVADSIPGNPNIYPTAKSCPLYKIDPLQIVRVGFNIHIKSKAVACRTAEAYETYVFSVLTGNASKAYGLTQLGACFTTSEEGAAVRVLQIIEVKGGACLIEAISAARGNPSAWTDISMVDKVL